MPLLGGCITGDDVSVFEDEVVNESFGPYTVVAPIDTGINVYHNHFIMNESYPQSLLDGLNVTMICDITTEGSWQERYEADKENCWDLISPSDIVWFLSLIHI